MKNQDIYAELGFLSIQFAEIEQIVKDILVKYITHDYLDNLIGNIITEEFSLEKRLNLLKDINKLSNDYEDKITRLITLIKDKQTLRNFLIHGLWQIHDNNGGIKIVVEKKKIKYKEIPIKGAIIANDKKKQKIPVTKEWRYSDFNVYTLAELKIVNLELSEIIKDGRDILVEIEEKGLD